MGFNIGNILKSVAPFIASALPGPLGVGAKIVLSEVFGIGKDASEEKLEAAIASATPEQITALKAAENGFKERMTALGYDHIAKLEELANAEMANARQREIELARAGAKDNTPMILAFGACLAFIGMLGYVLMANIDQWGQVKVSIVSGVIGTLSGVVLTIFAYYFGTSKGSEAKNAMLVKLHDKI